MNENDDPEQTKAPEESLPASPMTELMMSASHLFEFFTTLREAGFTEYQALYIASTPLRPEQKGPTT